MICSDALAERHRRRDKPAGQAHAQDRRYDIRLARWGSADRCPLIAGRRPASSIKRSSGPALHPNDRARQNRAVPLRRQPGASGGVDAAVGGIAGRPGGAPRRDNIFRSSGGAVGAAGGGARRSDPRNHPGAAPFRVDRGDSAPAGVVRPGFLPGLAAGSRRHHWRRWFGGACRALDRAAGGCCLRSARPFSCRSRCRGIGRGVAGARQARARNSGVRSQARHRDRCGGARSSHHLSYIGRVSGRCRADSGRRRRMARRARRRRSLADRPPAHRCRPGRIGADGCSAAADAGHPVSGGGGQPASGEPCRADARGRVGALRMGGGPGLESDLPEWKPDQPGPPGSGLERRKVRGGDRRRGAPECGALRR
jgi:hypothetical protein